MPSALLRRRWIVAILVGALVTTGGLAYAAIPDAGGVIHTCYTKSSGAWRVIDTGLGQSCKSNEAALDLYSKGGAEALFLDQAEADALYLGKTAKAADSDRLDGQDSSAFLGATAKAADSDKLDGRDSFHFVRGFDAALSAGQRSADDNQTTFPSFGYPPEGFYPGLDFQLARDTGGGTVLRATSATSFLYWWDGAFGTASLAGQQYEASFPIGTGSERHELWSRFSSGFHITTLDLYTLVGEQSCDVGFTFFKTEQDTPN
jgi:hypothetical protein